MSCALHLAVCSYMVDAADQDKMEASKNEFHNLLDKPQLNGIPVLVLANKRDLPGALDEREVIDRMYVLYLPTNCSVAMAFNIVMVVNFGVVNPR